MFANYVKPALLSSISISVNPSESGDVFRVAAVVEGVFNILGGGVMMLFPAWCLSWLAAPQSSMTPTATSMTQWLGALTWGLTPQLLLAVPNTRTAIESRQMVYICLLAGEGCLIPVMLWQAAVVNRRQEHEGGSLRLGLGDGGSPSGMSTRALLAASAVLASISIWRLCLLCARPDWLGSYRVIDRQGKGK